MRWRWKRARRSTESIDQTGAATAYPHRAGAHAPARADAPAVRLPSWATEPTAAYPEQGPLMTPGQEARGHGGRTRS